MIESACTIDALVALRVGHSMTYKPRIMPKPTVEEIRNRIREHLDWNSKSDEAHLLWTGYLAALLEWTHMLPDEYHELNTLLKPLVEDQRQQLFLGPPDSVGRSD